MIIGLNLDTSTPFGKTMVTILVSLAQFEREMTSKRVKDNAVSRLVNDGKMARLKNLWVNLEVFC
jgi:DNA invertase Pin-like site-specific DNA recombinase